MSRRHYEGADVIAEISLAVGVICCAVGVIYNTRSIRRLVRDKADRKDPQ